MGYTDQIPSYKSILGLLLVGLIFVTHWDTRYVAHSHLLIIIADISILRVLLRFQGLGSAHPLDAEAPAAAPLRCPAAVDATDAGKDLT